MSDSDETHFASGPGGAESSAGIPRVGDVIADKYRVDRIVGIGGMGVVLAVTHLQILEPYAIKFLLPRAAGDSGTVARFLREARAAVRIKSEHIARVSDVGQTKEGTPFIVMELLDGSDLGEVLAERGPLPIADAVEYLLQACEGIAEAHALGTVHRDLKPANLFLTRRSDGMPFVKVLDFGISKAAADAHGQSPVLTDTDAVFGSPAYMSPEQIRSAKNVDERTDIWALGIILHELMTGRTPFGGETAGAVLSAIAADPPEKLRSIRPDAPEELEAVVLRCLAKSVDHRFANVAELALALHPFKNEMGIASVGRIQRLSNPAAASGSAASEPSVKRSAPRPKVAGALAATDAPVTRGPAPAAGSRMTTVIVAVVGTLLVVGAAAAVLGRFASSRGGAGPIAAQSPSSPVVASALPVPPAPSSLATSVAVATSAASSSVAPRASAPRVPQRVPAKTKGPTRPEEPTSVPASPTGPAVPVAPTSTTEISPTSQ